MLFGEFIRIMTRHQPCRGVDQRQDRDLNDIVPVEQRAEYSEFVGMEQILRIMEDDAFALAAIALFVGYQRLPKLIEIIRLRRRAGMGTNDHADT